MGVCGKDKGSGARNCGMDKFARVGRSFFVKWGAVGHLFSGVP